jgi:hypothetical protein
MKILIRLNVKNEEWKECYVKTRYLGKKNTDFKFGIYVYSKSLDKYVNGFMDGFVRFCNDPCHLEHFLEYCKNSIETNYG